MSVKVFIPPFQLDLGTVAIKDDDYTLFEAGQIVGLPRINAAVVQLYQQAGSPPAIAFGCDPGHLRVIASMFRIARIRAMEIDDHADVEACRTRVAELGAGALDVLVSGRRLAGSTPIPRLAALMLICPTLSAARHSRFLARLDRTQPELTIVDLVGNCRRHGLWPGAVAETIVGQAIEVISDPTVARLTQIPHRDALRWCGDNIGRIELLQKAKGHRDGWCFHVIQAVRGKAAAEEWWKGRGNKRGGQPREKH